MNVNILITSISRKVWLVEAFKNALRKEKVAGKIITVDTNPLSAGFYVSDKYYLVPSSSDQNFISVIRGICEKENIQLIIPTRDAELIVFAENKKQFKKAGTEIMVSDPRVIETCSDKYKLYQFLRKNGIATPETIIPGRLDFSFIRYPLLVKSRTGSGSKDIFMVKNKGELTFFMSYIADPIIQEFIAGKEYTVDLFSDFDRRILSVVPRERIETFGGESYKSKTVKDSQMIKCAKDIAEKLGVVGHVTLQFIKDEDLVKLIEINPRFGGGAILGVKSGYNTPLLLIQLITGKIVEPQIGDFEENLIMLRYTQDLFIPEYEIFKRL